MVFKDRHGFTILEVLVAVVILSLAYVSVLQSFSLSLRNIGKIEEQRLALVEDEGDFHRSLRYDHQQNQQNQQNQQMDSESVDEFWQGDKFRLVQVTSASGELVSLRLLKMP